MIKIKYILVFSFIIFFVVTTLSFSTTINSVYFKNNLSKFIFVDTTSPGTLSPAEAYDLILKNKDNTDFIILDVRTKEEVDNGFIEGSQNIDFRSTDFKDEISKLDKNKIYLIYCKGGGRSQKAKDLMEELGFKNVMHIGGGINQWILESLPIIK